jgi:pSer/pThr/pTyr-binding forkhead associated (FHA) protein
LLDFLERSVERVIQAPVDSIFRQEIQPAEIERHLERAMLDNRRRASGANIMPNAYLVELSPHDYETIEPYKASLVRRLESWLTDRADTHNGTLLDRMRVEIKESEDARRRRPIVHASITDIGASVRPASRGVPHTPSAQRTQTYQVVGTEAGTCSLRVLTGRQAGTAFTIPAGESTLGRAPDSDIRIEANDVSRHHLRIERQGTRVQVTDLGSTNGTRVNGEPTHHATLRNGDEIVVGAQALRFIVS